MDKPEEVISADGSVAITDPGAIGRERQNAGDRFVVRISNLVAWLFPILMIAICSQVILRGAGMNQAWLDDFQWWLYGAAVLVGIAYAVTTDSHVRVDILYEGFSEGKKLRTNIFALVWLFLPFIILCWDVTFHYTLSSIQADEGSDSPNGLHNLWILKTFINLSFILMGIAAWSLYIRFLSRLTRPVLWKQLLFAFPSTMFLVNLAVYYAIWWAIWLGSPEGTTPREVGRHVFFDEAEFGNYDIKYTIMITLILTFVVIGAARLFSRNRTA
ncbi:TRAP transporter small permease subunit [uncultured Roseibium sp.]|uniref:TRAP transporter small permease subunit n=1 Tax=uncultured Roseibium sp. TaxID=1936171 RepID=UPI00260DA86D|nr:TRAP transporter small permease subunit [uncultured Roseibium sp.]